MKHSLTICAAALALLTACGQVEDVTAPATPEPASSQNQVADPRTPVAAMPDYSPAAHEIVQMALAGMDENVIRNQILLRRGPYQISPEELIRMSREGVSQSLITVIQQHDAQLAAESQARARAATDARLRLELAAAQATLANRPPTATSPPPAREPLPTDLTPAARPFYQALQPYGNWLRHGNLGYVWRLDPARRTSDWRPYTFNGRWLATDQGWYWHSDAPWGWAVFHYGRWEHDAASGWVWVPDTVWAPSWVTFRMSQDHLGWAPLPASASVVAGGGVYSGGRQINTGFNFGLPATHYTFIPLALAFRTPPADCRLSPAQIRRFFYGTTVINDIYVGTTLHVINRGVPHSYLRGRNAGPTVLSQIETTPQDQPGRHGSLFSRDGQSTVYRPTLSEITPTKSAMFTTASTAVQIPAHAPDAVTIAGRPAVDHSAGAPVVTGYTTAPARRRFWPQAAYQPPTHTAPNTLPPVPRFTPPNQGHAAFAAPVTGFAPAMPMSPPQPISSVPQTLGIPTPVTFPSGVTTNSPFTQPAWRYRASGTGR